MTTRKSSKSATKPSKGTTGKRGGRKAPTVPPVPVPSTPVPEIQSYEKLRRDGVQLFDGFTLTDHQRLFLSAFAVTGNVTNAAELSGLTRQSHYRWQWEGDAEYAKAFAAARDVALDRLEGEARRRALNGSDVLMMFLLKAHRPEVFRDQHNLTVKGKVDHGGEVAHKHTLEELTHDQRAERIRELLGRAERRLAGRVDASGANGNGCPAASPAVSP